MFEDELKDEEAIPTGDTGGEDYIAQEAPEAKAAPQLAPEEAIPTGEPGQVPMPRPRQPQGIAEIAADGKPNPIRRIVSYLMGEGAANPQEMAAATSQLDPAMQPSERNLLAVEQAAKQGGTEAAWKIVQGHRVAFNAKQAFGYAALNGTQQKPPDVNAAVDAANQAQSHILDGSDVQFSATPQGVTATVSGADGQPSQINLTPDQFRRYLNVGADGQWDKLMQAGVPAALQKIASAQGGQTRISQQRPLQPRQREAIDTNLNAPSPQRSGSTRVAPPGQAIGETPSTLNLSGNDAPRDMSPPDLGYSPQNEARARDMYPWASQQPQQRQAVAGMTARKDEMENKLNIAKEGAQGKVQAADVRGEHGTDQQRLKNVGAQGVAETRATAWKYASDQRRASAQIAADAKAAHDGNVQAQQRIESARKAIAVKRATAGVLSKEDEALEQQLVQTARGGGQPQRQQAAPQQAPQQSPGRPPVAGAKFYKGNWYTKGPSGESVPVQQ